MLAIDTNLVVRYLTRDHPEQSAKAKALIDGQPVFVGKTVLLESEWVLRSVYRLGAPEVSRLLREFAGLPTVTTEDAWAVASALDDFERGMDFADALHLASAAGCEAMVTFDRRFAKLAASREGIVVRTV